MIRIIIERLSIILLVFGIPIIVLFFTFPLFFTESLDSHYKVWHFFHSNSGTLPHMTLAEFSHMEDVRQVFMFVLSTCVIAVVSLMLLYINRGVISPQNIHFSGKLCLSIALFLLFNVLFFFEYAFEIFHKVIFQDNYLFSYDSTLITLYPESFFIFLGIIWFVAVISASTLLMYYEKVISRFFFLK